MRAGQRLVGLLWRWHRRTGVVIFVFLVLLAITGVVLNHTSALGLDRRFVDWPWLTGAYGDSSHDIRAYPLEQHWITRSAGGALYLDASEVGRCHGELVGVAQAQDLLLVACAEELVLLTPRGELVEQVTASTGLPTPVQGLGMAADAVLLRTGGDWVLADLDRLEFAGRPAAGVLVQEIARGELPAAIRDRIPAPAQWLTWERVLLDLHSGRLFGNIGVVLVDAVGILLLCIACSGVTMWWFHRGRRRLRQRGP